jgi:uncharacterized membrane protein
MTDERVNTRNNLLKLLPPVGLAAVAFAYLNYVTWTQYASHRFYLADIGLLDVTIANTIRGAFMKAPTLGWNYLGVHFRPVLLGFVPLYLVYDHIMTLATMQNVFLVFALIPLYFFACSKTHIRWLSLCFAFAYVFNHFTLSLHLAIHIENIAIFGFFLMFLTAQRRMTWLYIPALILTLSVREEMGLFTALYGVYIAFAARDKRKKIGILTIVISIVWVIAAFSMMAWIRPAGGVWKGGVSSLDRYASMGDSWSSILVYTLTHPWMIVYRIFSRPVFYLLFASVGFLPLLHPRSLWLLIPGALIMLTADFDPMNKLHYYYSYPFLPFLFLSAIEGADAVLNNKRYEKKRLVIAYVMGMLLVTSGIIGFLSPTKTEGLKVRPFKVTDHHRMLGKLIKRVIPPDASVAAQYEIFCQVPHRKVQLPLWPENLDKVEYIIIDTSRPSPDVKLEDKHAMIEKLQNPPFKSAGKADTYYIFQKE